MKTTKHPSLMSVETAIHLIALDAIYRAAEAFSEDGWENYPDIGENDWLRVLAEIKEICAEIHPTDYQLAYAILEARAGKDE